MKFSLIKNLKKKKKKDATVGSGNAEPHINTRKHRGDIFSIANEGPFTPNKPILSPMHIPL